MTTTRPAPLPPGVVPTPAQQFTLGIMAGPGDVYVHGPPGTGKSMLLDATFAATPRSARWHCAAFFRAVHAALPGVRRDVGAAVAEVTGGARTVFFDEFHLHDVADAVYLDHAVRWWAENGVRVVTTSNYPPDDLLPNPVFHHAARPVIDRIHDRFRAVELDEGIDHRRSGGGRASGFATGAWLPPTPHPPVTEVIRVGGRPLTVIVGEAGQLLEATFARMCGDPWAVADYLELLGGRAWVTIHDVPDLALVGREPGQRFANLIDVAFDLDVPLTVHAESPPERLLDADFPPLDVARTLSRLATLAR